MTTIYANYDCTGLSAILASPDAVYLANWTASLVMNGFASDTKFKSILMPAQSRLRWANPDKEQTNSGNEPSCEKIDNSIINEDTEFWYHQTRDSSP